MSKSHRPPSRQRYDKAHPALTIHLPDQATLDRIRQLSERSGLPMGEIVRRSLSVVGKGIDESWERGREAGCEECFEVGHEVGYEQGRRDATIVAPCSLCGLDMPLRPGSAMAAAAVQHLSGWSHGACAKEFETTGRVEWKGS